MTAAIIVVLVFLAACFVLDRLLRGSVDKWRDDSEIED